MTKQIIICDLCGTEHSKEDTVHLEVKATGGLAFPITRDNYWNAATRQLDICRECLEKKGFVVGGELSNAKKEEQNEKTLEDKLLDILADVGIEPKD